MNTRPITKGFVVAEWLLVIAAIGVIAVILAPSFPDSTGKDARQLHKENKKYINAVVARYHQDNGMWPASDLSDIGANPTYFPDGVPSNPVNPSRPYTINPVTHRVDTP